MSKNLLEELSWDRRDFQIDSERNEHIFKLRFQNEMTYHEIAEEVGLTKERCRQIVQRVVRLVRKRLEVPKVIESLEQRISRLETDNRKLRSGLLEDWTKDNELDYISIHNLDVSVRVYNTLRALGLGTIGQVKLLLEEEGISRFLKARNFGNKSAEELLRAMREYYGDEIYSIAKRSR